MPGQSRTRPVWRGAGSRSKPPEHTEHGLSTDLPGSDGALQGSYFLLALTKLLPRSHHYKIC